MRDDAVITPRGTSKYDVIVERATGGEAFVTDPSLLRTYENDWTGLYGGRCALVARPRSLEDVQSLLEACHNERVPIVTQGGNTGLVGGSTPAPTSSELPIVLSTRLLGEIEEFDAASAQVTVGVG